MGTYRQPSANIDKSHAVVNAQLDKTRKEIGDRLAGIAKSRQAAKLKALKNLEKEQKAKKKEYETIKDDLNKTASDFDKARNRTGLATDRAAVETQDGVDEKVFKEGPTGKVNPWAVRAAIVEQQTGLKGEDVATQENIDKAKVKENVRDKIFRTSANESDLEGEQPKVDNTLRAGTLTTPKGMTMDKVDIKAISEANEVYTLTDQATDLTKAALKDMRDVGITEGVNSASYKSAKRTAENVVKDFNTLNEFLNKTVGTNYNESYDVNGDRVAPNKANAFLYDFDPDLENNWEIRASLTDDMNGPKSKSERWSIHADGENYVLEYSDPNITNPNEQNAITLTVAELDQYIKGKGRGKGLLQTLDIKSTDNTLDMIYDGGEGNMNAGATYKTLVETVRKYKEGEQVNGEEVTRTDVIKTYVAANEYMEDQIDIFVNSSFKDLPFVQRQSVYQMVPGFENVEGGRTYLGTDEQNEAVKSYLVDYFKNKYTKGNADEVIKSSNIKIKPEEIKEEKNKYKATVSETRAKDLIEGDAIEFQGSQTDNDEIRYILDLDPSDTGYNLMDIAKNTTNLTKDLNGLTNLALILNNVSTGKTPTAEQYEGKYLTGRQVLEENPNAEDSKGGAIDLENFYVLDKIGKDDYAVVPLPGITEGTKEEKFIKIKDEILGKTGGAPTGVKDIIKRKITDDDIVQIDFSDPDQAREYFYKNRQQSNIS